MAAKQERTMETRIIDSTWAGHEYTNTIDATFEVKQLVCENDLFNAYRLRHKIFAEELRWVDTNGKYLEVDGYDKSSVHFGVLYEDMLLSYLRLIVPGQTFMMEREFIDLVGNDHVIRKANDTCEVSRLCVSPLARSGKIPTNFGDHGVAMHLYKSVYQWCDRNMIRYLYLVVEKKVARMLAMAGFPCKVIGEPKVMPDGVVAVAAMMDWREFEAQNAWKRSSLLEWFNQDQSGHGMPPLRQPEIYSQRQAFA